MTALLPATNIVPVAIAEACHEPVKVASAIAFAIANRLGLAELIEVASVVVSVRWNDEVDMHGIERFRSHGSSWVVLIDRGGRGALRFYNQDGVELG